MTIRIDYRGILTVAALSLSWGASTAEPPPLAHNPFARPPSQISNSERPVLKADGSVQEIDLRATLVGPRSRFANVAGKTLRPGDEIQGYTLLQVFEDRAVFAREGGQLTIYVKPDMEEDDE